MALEDEVHYIQLQMGSIDFGIQFAVVACLLADPGSLFAWFADIQSAVLETLLKSYFVGPESLSFALSKGPSSTASAGVAGL